MATGGQEKVSSQEEVKEAEQENVLRRVASMPLVNSTYKIAANAYNTTKDSNPYVKSLLDTAEKGVKTLTEAAIKSALPFLDILETQIETASEYASRGLDTLEEKLPVLHLTADEVASNTKEMVSTKMADTKEAIANKLSGAVDMTKEAVQSGMETTKAAISHSVSTVAETKVGQIALSGAEAILDSAEESIDYYLPMTDEELAELGAAVKNGGDLVAMRQNEKEDYLVRLGALSAKLRNRAYRHSLEKLHRVREKIRASLLHIERTIRLIEYMKNEAGEKISEHHEKFRQMVLEWSKAHSGTKEQLEACLCAHVDVQAVTIIQSMFQQLQTTFQTLVSGIQGFPSSLQDKVHQIHQSTKELHDSLLSAGSFQELSNTLLAQSHQTLKKAQEYMEELRDYITHNTPLSWFVGPFMLPSRQPTETAESEEPRELD